MFSGPFCFVKLMFRWEFAGKNPEPNGDLNTDTWGWSGVRIEIIALSICIFLYPFLIEMFERNKLKKNKEVSLKAM